MNCRMLLVAGVMLLSTRGAEAQAVLRPDPELPPEMKAVQKAIYELRDSLGLIEAAGARLALDRKGASDQSLRSRARVLADRCRAALPVADSTKALVVRSEIPNPDPRGMVKRFDKAVVDVRAKLVWCEGEFTRLSDPKHADELRGYGIGRAQQMNSATQAYVGESMFYMRHALGARYVPNMRGAGSVPSGS